MDIQYSRYRLTPKKRINRLSSMETKEGVYLSTIINGRRVFADYFPHIPLGDESVEHFLANFKDQKTEYQQKILTHLKLDLEYRHAPARKFLNHQLWTGKEEIISPVVKYKMLTPDDQTFHDALKKGIRLRLDANAMFTQENVHLLLDPLQAEWIKLIDYVEDPLSSSDWSSFPLRRARDFIPADPFDLYIYKPNCEMKPKFSELIYSAYLGSALGSWHTYCEMISEGNLQIVQGIIGLGFYEEVQDFFTGDFASGFLPDLSIVKEMYEDLDRREWKDLCSM